MIKVRATELGFYGGSRKRPEAVFWISGKEELGKWMEVIDETDDAKPAKGGKAKAKASEPEPEAKPPVSTGDQDVI